MHSGYYGERKKSKMEIFLDILAYLVIVINGLTIYNIFLHFCTVNINLTEK